MVKRTYISLFSSAGVGCYGFLLEGFECIATNELLEARLEIQKANKKCKYDEGYVLGDITREETKQKLFNALSRYKEYEQAANVDVVIATPPCQGMSTANYKKKNEINRNSLVVEAVHITQKIKPNVFVFENVQSFLKTMCIDVDDEHLSIEKMIKKNLGQSYNIYSKIVNFKDYGVPSSRPRTLVIGTKKDLINISPLNLFPDIVDQISVRDTISDLPTLSFGEISHNDVYHFFREYPTYMREWITGIKEGESAFDKHNPVQPYKLVDGMRLELKGSYMGNKFKRLKWDLPAACIATRNDQLASQSTIHPSEDRVLSIRELMRLMTIPSSFQWTNVNVDLLRTEYERKKYIKSHELNIRRSIGEAVPTRVFQSIAKKVQQLLDFQDFTQKKKISEDLSNFYIASYLYERKLDKVKETGSFYTPQSVVFDALCRLRFSGKPIIHILEPAVGMGAFLPQLFALLEPELTFELDVVDINKQALLHLEMILNNLDYDRKRIKINFIEADFLLVDFDKKYDLVIGNPPFFKVEGQLLRDYRRIYRESTLSNIAGFFLKKTYKLSPEIILVMPKTFLMTPEFNSVKSLYEETNIVSIYDYGVHFFEKVFVEILAVHFKQDYHSQIYIESKLLNSTRYVHQNYIFHKKHWLLYRDDFFDNYINTLQLDVFDFFRDRQLTNSEMKSNGKTWVIKSKNILDDGTITHKDGYDKYIDDSSKYLVGRFINTNSIIMTSFTYNTRAARLPINAIVNGSIAVLIPKKSLKSSINLKLYSTSAFRKYYAIVKNNAKFTINIDANSIYYIGVEKDANKRNS